MIVTLGDLLLDVIVRLEQPLAEGADADAVTRLGPGGQAANVAAWVAELGGRARFVGKRADDEAGATARARARALRRRGPRAGRRGPHRHRRLARRRGRRAARWPPTAASRPTCAPTSSTPAWLDGCEHLHLPGYSLLRSPIDEAALRAAALAPRVSVDLSSWSAIRDFGPERFRERLEELRPDVVFANEDEERILGGPLPGCTWVAEARRARRALRRRRAAGAAGGGRRHDRRRRRARGGLPRRRPGARARGGGALRGEARRDAVKESDRRLATRSGRRSPSGAPVVALETTLVAHGFPAGEGVEVGLESERRVREAGAVPATIGVLDGALRVGLTEDELGALRRRRTQGRPARPRRRRSSRARSARRRSAARSPPAARPGSASWAPAGSAASTAASRRRRTSPPTSASSSARRRWSSRRASSRSSTCPATAELLETLGVPVLGFRTDDLPLFYAAHGGPPVSARVESAEEAAPVARAHWRLGRHTSVLLGRPADESLDDVEPLIERALAEAARAGRHRPGRDAVRALLPAPRDRRAHARRQPRADRRQRSARRGGGRRLCRSLTPSADLTARRRAGRARAPRAAAQALHAAHDRRPPARRAARRASARTSPTRRSSSSRSPTTRCRRAAGEHTVDSFSALVADQPGYRPWGLESAALDLALRQAGRVARGGRRARAAAGALRRLAERRRASWLAALPGPALQARRERLVDGRGRRGARRDGRRRRRRPEGPVRRRVGRRDAVGRALRPRRARRSRTRGSRTRA